MVNNITVVNTKTTIDWNLIPDDTNKDQIYDNKLYKNANVNVTYNCRKDQQK